MRHLHAQLVSKPDVCLACWRSRKRLASCSGSLFGPDVVEINARKFERLHCTPSKARSGRISVRASAATAQDLLSDLSLLAHHLARDGPDGDTAAVAMVHQLKESGKIRAFGNSRKVPKQLYSLEDLRLNKIEPAQLLTPSDDTLSRVRTFLQVAVLGSLAAASYAFHMDFGQIVGVALALASLSAVDQVANGGGLESLALDIAARAVNPGYQQRVAAHEAGHFLAAYLMGLLPKNYTLSSLDAFQRYQALNVQAGTQFCDASFQAEVASGKLSSSSLDVYCCVALAGVCQEYIKDGKAEGGLNDVQQLDNLLKALRVI